MDQVWYPGSQVVRPLDHDVEELVQAEQDGRDSEDHAHEPERLADRVIEFQRRQTCHDVVPPGPIMKRFQHI